MLVKVSAAGLKIAATLCLTDHGKGRRGVPWA